MEMKKKLAVTFSCETELSYIVLSVFMITFTFSLVNMLK